MYQPTAEGRLGNFNAFFKIYIDRIKAALEKGLTAEVKHIFGEYEFNAEIIKREGENGRFAAYSSRKEIFRHMRERGFDIDSLTY